MNIFVLDMDTAIASQFHCDRHIVKMPLETAQMLCSSHHFMGGSAPYKPTHLKHPCNIWIVQSIENYRWLCELGKNLCREYTYRYNKTHACESVIDWCIENQPKLPNVPLTPFALAMPEEYKTENCIESYRAYYAGEKRHLFNWKKRNQPYWLFNKII
jgi:hypothetical protein